MKKTIWWLIAGLAVMGRQTVLAEGIAAVSPKTLAGLQKLAGETSVINDIEAQNGEKSDAVRDGERQKKWRGSSEVSEFVRHYREKESCRTMKDYFTGVFPLVDCYTLDAQGRVVGSLYKPEDFLQDAEPTFRHCIHEGAGKIYVNESGLTQVGRAKTVEVAVPVIRGTQTVGVLVATVLLEE